MCEEGVRERSLEEKLIELQQRNEFRGRIALIIVLVVILWFFSVPPTIRRTSICGPRATDVELLKGSCVSSETWLESITNHCATCGKTGGAPCIDFDFSVDPESKTTYSEAVRALQEGTP